METDFLYFCEAMTQQISGFLFYVTHATQNHFTQYILFPYAILATREAQISEWNLDSALTELKVQRMQEIFIFLIFKLEDNFFTTLCWFLPYTNVNQT